jgi:hypothetical protein
MTKRPAATRRNNAPVRPYRAPATTIPDLLFALTAAAWTMAVIFVLASFLSDDVTAGEAGKLLARIFAGALFMAGLFIGLLGIGLLREERGEFNHYRTPVLVGIVIGGLESLLFLIPLGTLLWAPFLLLFFVLRPVRRWIQRRFDLTGSFRA